MRQLVLTLGLVLACFSTPGFSQPPPQTVNLMEDTQYTSGVSHALRYEKLIQKLESIKTEHTNIGGDSTPLYDAAYSIAEVDIRTTATTSKVSGMADSVGRISDLVSEIAALVKVINYVTTSYYDYTNGDMDMSNTDYNPAFWSILSDLQDSLDENISNSYADRLKDMNEVTVCTIDADMYALANLVAPLTVWPENDYTYEDEWEAYEDAIDALEADVTALDSTVTGLYQDAVHSNTNTFYDFFTNGVPWFSYAYSVYYALGVDSAGDIEQTLIDLKSSLEGSGWGEPS